jgi:PsbP-like protein
MIDLYLLDLHSYINFTSIALFKNQVDLFVLQMLSRLYCETIMQIAYLRKMYFLVFGPMIMISVFSLFSFLFYDAFGESCSNISIYCIHSSTAFIAMKDHNLVSYKNSTFGITTKYPSDWIINNKSSSFFQQDLHKQNFTSIVVFSYFNKSNNNLTPLFDESVYVRDASPHLTLTQFTEQRKDHLSSIYLHSFPGIGMVKFVESNTTTLAGYPAYATVYKFSREAGYPLLRMELWTIKDGKIYMITFTDYTGEDPPFFSKESSVVQDIINSFQITRNSQ